MDAPQLDYGDMVIAQMAQRLEAAEAEIERLRAVVEAARCIRHWHDVDNDGMVVSGEHVRALWQALHDLDAVPNATLTRGAQTVAKGDAGSPSR